jgi:hypothetical protein
MMGSFACPLLYSKVTNWNFSVDAILCDESYWCLFNSRGVYGVVKALDNVPSWSVSPVVYARFSFLCYFFMFLPFAALAAGVT